MFLGLICAALQLYGLAVLARIILSWIRVPSDHAVGRIGSLLAVIVDPPLRAIRSVMPDIPIGPARLDLSPMVLLLAVFIVRRVIC